MRPPAWPRVVAAWMIRLFTLLAGRATAIVSVVAFRAIDLRHGSRPGGLIVLDSAGLVVVQEQIVVRPVARFQEALRLQMPALRQAWQRDIAAVVSDEELVDELVDVSELPPQRGAMPNFSKVHAQRLEVFVHIGRLARQPQVERAQHADVLVVLLFDELEDDLLLGLDLQHFEHEAHKLGGLAIPAVRPADVSQLHPLVDQRLGCQPEAVLLPEQIGVDLRAQNLLDQILRIRAVHAQGERIGRVRHVARGARAPSPLADPKLSDYNLRIPVLHDDPWASPVAQAEAR